ncbi:C-type lectin domain family 14 member A [Pagrus major]|uniref:C-type lectin domain family 14 member A n=1 Tax=Pagrus major TaxID=143350 RepID=UPI003CC8ABB5
MASWFCWIWTVLVLFTNTSSEPASPPRYIVHHTKVSFDRAMEVCSHHGILTTILTEQEAAEILEVVSRSPQNQNQSTFWVGLRKVKDECVVPTLPLKGFKWTEDGSEETEVSRWTEEPKPTCTSVRCAALRVESDGSTETRWGLIPVSCRNHNQFICKLTDRLTGATLKPATPEPEPKPDPATPEPKTAPSAPPTLEPEPKPDPATPEPETAPSAPPTLEPEPVTAEPHKPGPKTATQRPEPTGPELQGPDPEPVSDTELESDSCEHTPRPRINGSRYLSLDPDNSSRIQVECWSSAPVELHCSGRPAMWRLPDDSPANLTTVCQPCGPCRHTCVNMEGSSRCVCTDKDGKHHDADSPECVSPTDNSLLLWVLVAVAAVVVIVVVVAVTVKCCLMRRSEKRAMKKEKMVMKSKDSFDTANEKVAR